VYPISLALEIKSSGLYLYNFLDYTCIASGIDRIFFNLYKNVTLFFFFFLSLV
jgi:hypothetical protein